VFHILRHVGCIAEVLTFLTARTRRGGGDGGKIHSNACAEVSHRSDTRASYARTSRGYAWKKGTSARDNRSLLLPGDFRRPACTTGMTLESFVDCEEREDEPRWRIISDSRLPRPFSTVAKSLGGNSCMGNQRERGRERGLTGRKNEEKRSEKEGKKEGVRGTREREAEENSEKHFRVSGKNSLSRIEEFTRTCART
jgi:hypothetical protein